jgi:folylpolyglutamate synthase/dihydropteroate synthase
MSPGSSQVTITARFDLDPDADVVKAKSIIDSAHNNAVIAALRRYLESA